MKLVDALRASLIANLNKLLAEMVSRQVAQTKRFDCLRSSKGWSRLPSRSWYKYYVKEDFIR